MSTHKHIDRICVVAIIATLIITVAFMNWQKIGIQASAKTMGYEDKIFDTSKVHTIDIVIDDWDSFIATAASEEYTACAVVIDNEAVKNVAIRGKGNTSLSTVSSLGSERYSFKIEFDQYEDGNTYYGLDKLCLNNIISDNTYMKDYLSYRMMDEFGADAPLCSYVWVTVNGEDWGLYMACEAVEESFMERVYGGSGNLYKPDSMSMGGGGPGHGKDFNIDDFMSEFEEEFGEDFDISELPEQGGNFDPGNMPDQSEDFNPGNMPEQGGNFNPGGMPGRSGGMGGFGPGGGMGSDDVKLKYTDDDTDSYSNIFDNAKTEVTYADKTRLIKSLKNLSEGTDLENTLDMDEVLRYFVVHNYVVNGDSYTGSMVHNYYLYESGGKLSMIPWDYNLAFGGFQGGNASGAVNDAIDSPLSVSGDGSRPMADWIYQNEEYTELYHQYFEEFLETVDVQAIIDEAYELIAPYVEKDPTAFCTYDEFEQGVSALKEFCKLRTESVKGQLDGTIPSTDSGQNQSGAALVDASSVNLSDMGSFGGGGNGFGGGNFSGMTPPDGQDSFSGMTPPDGNNGSDSLTPPNGEGDSEEPDPFGDTDPFGGDDSSEGTNPFGNGKGGFGGDDSFEGTNPFSNGNGGFGGMTPPDGSNGFGGMTPPDGSNGFGGITPPDGSNGFGGMTPPDGSNGFGGTDPFGNNNGSDNIAPPDDQNGSDEQTPPDDQNGSDEQTPPEANNGSGRMSPPNGQNGSGSMTLPDGQGDFGGRSGSRPGAASYTATTWIMLGVSVAVLLAGIAAAALFTRRRRG